MIHFIQYDQKSGSIIGGGHSPDDTQPPEGFLVCTEDQKKNYSNYKVDLKTKTLVPLSTDLLLEKLKKEKVNQLQARHKSTLSGSCPVSVKGNSYSFPLTTVSTSSLLSSAFAANQALTQKNKKFQRTIHFNGDVIIQADAQTVLDIAEQVETFMDKHNTGLAQSIKKVQLASTVSALEKVEV